MQTAPQNWAEYFADLSHKNDIKISISSPGGSGQATYGMESVKSISLVPALLTADKWIGNAISQKLTMTILASINLPRMAKIELSARLTLDGSYTDYVPVGTFWVDERQKGRVWTPLTCYDAMLKTEQPFINDTLEAGTWPITMAAAVNEICTRIGVTLDSRTIILTGSDYVVSYPNDLTMREVLGYIAVAHGGNWIITPAGQLRLVVLQSPGTASQVLGKEVTSFSSLGNTQTISRVTLYDDAANAYSAGDDTGYAIEADCPYATQAIADALCNTTNGTLHNVEYVPFEATKARLNPLIELGDTVSVNDVSSIVATMNLTLSKSYVSDISCPADQEVDHEYPYLTSVERQANRAVKQGATYNGVTISRKDGIVIEKNEDGTVSAKAILSGDTIAMQALVNGALANKLYFDPVKGTYVFLGALDIVATTDGNSTDLNINGADVAVASKTGLDNAASAASNAQSTASDAMTSATANATDLANYVTSNAAALADIQSQIDGSITTWFYAIEPTDSNEPASEWTTTDLKNTHLGDLYYDTTTGYCYRWQVASQTYSWSRISDVDVTKALADASTAQDTADSKRRVFVNTPTPPYDIGDLWAQGSGGDVLRCSTAKTSAQSYVATDWVKASKYTDDTTANTANSLANAIRNGTASGGTFINGKEIYSPLIIADTIAARSTGADDGADFEITNADGTVVYGKMGYNSWIDINGNTYGGIGLRDEYDNAHLNVSELAASLSINHPTGETGVLAESAKARLYYSDVESVKEINVSADGIIASDGVRTLNILNLALTADKIVYVSTSGSDATGDGTSGAPWATIQHAIDQCPVITGAYTYTIKVSDGTYAGFKLHGKTITLDTVSSTPHVTIGGSTVEVGARLTTPGTSAFTFSNATGYCLTVSNSSYATFLGGITLSGKYGGTTSMSSSTVFNATLSLSVTTDYGLVANVDGDIYATTVSGSCVGHLFCAWNGSVLKYSTNSCTYGTLHNTNNGSRIYTGTQASAPSY